MSEMQWGAAAAFPQVYEELGVPAFFRTSAELMLRLADVREGERVLDVASGTGVIPRLLRERGVPAARIVGSDLTPAMLDVAREAPFADGVEWIHADGQDLPFGDEEFDVLFCHHGMQFFPDLEAGAREARRVLAPGGRAVVATWAALEQQVVNAAVTAAATAVLPDLAGAAGQPFSMDPARLGAAFEAAGFAGVDVCHETIDTHWDTAADAVRFMTEGTPLSLLLGEQPPEDVARAKAAALERVRALEGPAGVDTPMSETVVVARV